MKLSLAPLQGFTDLVFRRAFAKHIGGIDQFYTPFLILQNGDSLKSSHRREVDPNVEENLIPQFIGNSLKEFIFFRDYLIELGYSKMNWNLGCPFPMLAKKKKGSGLLPYPEMIEEILSDGLDDRIELSIKMRIGYESSEELETVLNVLNKFNLSEIIVHPRLGKQMYKGDVDLEAFGRVLILSKHPVIYNGDICNMEDYQQRLEQFPNLEQMMIGRGLLQDLFLPLKIKGEELPTAKERLALLEKLHGEIYDSYTSYLSGDTQLLSKLKPMWEYFSANFNNDRKVYKAIKKSGGMKKYNAAVAFAFQQGVKE
ncbi:tRNA-dihydrouridine synthase family protein [Ancylomarina euxinus]|uniref:tRNA-dihydrouridine synthase n=1 Tax=Ancylomarina euxinus TaxID=2283627 RepID=A0A425Y6L4_9BACT|nr:tRNA-dihydrouridine synthase family protein [Ancylomarina euxinus]MCZ4694145.1 tRNA-dihydrouridine synthase family protein [Ancylomarina euxinus]MUP15811.1 tRNA-dihydrouridine synthase family protein [Ancylomarina euxinus]RRG23985.1 tRNA-dihydrouridine synthase family protein [Ancylomarina euxinus]